MRIGELAKAAATPVETIRYYEREGLLPEAPRTAGNYRVYGDDQLERLAFIRHCRSLDMTLDEIRVLLRFRDAPGEDCGVVNRLLDEHIGHVEERIRELRVLRQQLHRLREQCPDSTNSGDCGIIGGLEAAAADPGSPLPSNRLGHVHGSHHPGEARTAPGGSDDRPCRPGAGTQRPR